MATFNGERYVGEQLESILRQTRLPDELVISDDDSSDQTLLIVRAFQRKAPFKVIISKNESNLGFIRNFEKALRLCTGDIIFLCDQDDVWFNNKLEDVLDVFLRHPEISVAINDQIIADANLSPTSLTKLENLKRAGLPDAWFITGCCTSFRREWLDYALPFPSTIRSHDSWINELAVGLGLRLVHPAPLQFYRRHGINASASRNIDVIQKQGRLSRINYHLSHGLQDLSAEWAKSLDILSHYIERFTYISESDGSPKIRMAAKDAITDYTNRLLVVQARLAIVSLPRWRRGASVLRLLSTGGYKNLSGLGSALKDLLRPKAASQTVRDNRSNHALQDTTHH